MSEDTPLTFGPCCACGKAGPLNTIVMLPVKAPVAGTGWGCFICGLPSDGALAALCDACADDMDAGSSAVVIRWAIRGDATSEARVPKSELTESFHHDMDRHEGEQR